MLIQYEQGNSLLHRWDPLSKLAVLMCTAVVAMLWDGALLQAILLAGCIIAARWAGGLSLRHLLRGIKLIAVVAIPYFVLTSLTVPGETVWFQWGPIRLTAESVNQAGEMSLRMITLFLSSLAYIVSTDPQELVAEMVRRLRIPYRFAFGISAALTFLPTLEEEGASIRAAQQVRGHRPPKGIAGRLSWWGRFVAAVLLNSLRRVQQTAGAMESKGFGAYPKRTFRKEVVVPFWGPAAAIIAVVLTAWSWWTV
ncbi:energy-coupling factor transporter transmembrane protein EcfT [Paenibacillus sp. N3/727]|uniref:energy-coupling factor transporter transmembrane component T family protein n=1 Tax=Paenibacillus sp. N3/727 TaxID=2925845 RepID=UPI001F53B43F|nr:energy-coupling factor transporter transmembrane protein EcfT [Paenibacillus sp. N3/727]UNK19213.1 energy-coupling factor transporter transmembrane protein EcfT [Paenibacillus sp. N3/727]